MSAPTISGVAFLTMARAINVFVLSYKVVLPCTLLVSLVQVYKWQITSYLVELVSLIPVVKELFDSDQFADSGWVLARTLIEVALGLPLICFACILASVRLDGRPLWSLRAQLLERWRMLVSALAVVALVSFALAWFGREAYRFQDWIESRDAGYPGGLMVTSLVKLLVTCILVWVNWRAFIVVLPIPVLVMESDRGCNVVKALKRSHHAKLWRKLSVIALGGLVLLLTVSLPGLLASLYSQTTYLGLDEHGLFAIVYVAIHGLWTFPVLVATVTTLHQRILDAEKEAKTAVA